MITEQGNSRPDYLDPALLATDIARTVTSSLRNASSASAPPPSGWMAFAAALDQLITASPELRDATERMLARTARAAMATGDQALPAWEDFLSALQTPSSAPRGGTYARAFWWGFHIKISREDLRQFLATAAPINTIIGAIGGGIPSPAAPFIAAAAAFVAGALSLLEGLDRGGGVYVSMSWFAPGIFIPTSV